ncbi:MAG: methyl-accepting chemotaxis protein [Candidatus Omnitrophota bacterium]
MAKSYRRRQYFISKEFQLKYVGVILLFMFLVAFFSALTIYYTTWMLLGEKLANVYPQGRLALILRHANVVLFWRLIAVTPLVAFGAVFLSHRIAGPIYRIKKDLDSVADGNFALRIRLRKTDELKDVADAINKVLDVLECVDNRNSSQKE